VHETGGRWPGSDAHREAEVAAVFPRDFGEAAHL
jgi:hypothetical protein